ncbi:hypothetical protein [Bacillus fonticola]|uniref:hypothetical protein n=1 Tax=Bacillus fonticola TaxID=2728853 RepID=UPI0014727A5A|nr:hypothetical protein [Bacillus fonticola]
MRSKRSWMHKGLILQDLRSFGWVSVLYAFILFFLFPMQVMMELSSSDNSANPYYSFDNMFEAMFQTNELFSVFLIATYPVLVGMIMFRYTHVKLSVDTLHSMPFTRTQSFWSHVTSASILLYVPVLINFLVLLLIQLFTGVGGDIYIPLAWEWTWQLLLGNSFMFAIAVFIGMCTGLTLLQGALVYILMAFPAGITLLSVFNAKQWLQGIPIDYFVSRSLELFIPLFNLIENFEQDVNYVELIAYILLTIGIIVASWGVYKFRPSEAANQAVAFRWLQPVFVFGIATCFMLLFGLYFGETNQSKPWLLAGYFFGGLFGYTIAQMILNKSIRIFHKWRGFVGFAGVVAILIMGLHFDALGFQKRVPDVAEIDAVYFSEYLSDYSVYRSLQQLPGDDRPSEFVRMARKNYESPEAIAILQALHKEITATIPFEMNRYEMSDFISFGYTLANGDELVRSYQVTKGTFDRFFAQLYETKEFKDNSILSNKEIEGIRQIGIYGQNDSTPITNKEDIQTFMEILKRAIQDETGEERLQAENEWKYGNGLQSIGIELENNFVDIPLGEHYTELRTWLEENGY